MHTIPGSPRGARSKIGEDGAHTGRSKARMRLSRRAERAERCLPLLWPRTGAQDERARGSRQLSRLNRRAPVVRLPREGQRNRRNSKEGTGHSPCVSSCIRRSVLSSPGPRIKKRRTRRERETSRETHHETSRDTIARQSFGDTIEKQISQFAVREMSPTFLRYVGSVQRNNHTRKNNSSGSLSSFGQARA